MKRLFVIPLMLVALALAGCAGFEKSVLDGGLSLTATVQNPITDEQQAAVEVTYGIAASGVLAYADLRRCKAGEVASLNNLCSSWPIVLKMKNANRIARKQILNLRIFMDGSDQINAITAYNAARAALADLKTAAASTGLK